MFRNTTISRGGLSTFLQGAQKFEVTPLVFSYVGDIVKYII